MVVARPAVPRCRSTPKAQKRVPDAPRLTPSNCVKPVDYTQLPLCALWAPWAQLTPTPRRCVAAPLWKGGAALRGLYNPYFTQFEGRALAVPIWRRCSNKSVLPSFVIFCNHITPGGPGQDFLDNRGGLVLYYSCGLVVDIVNKPNRKPPGPLRPWGFSVTARFCSAALCCPVYGSATCLPWHTPLSPQGCCGSAHAGRAQCLHTFP